MTETNSRSAAPRAAPFAGPLRTRWPGHERATAVLIGAALLVYLAVGVRYRFGALSRPGPGFFPRVLALAGLGLVIACLLRADAAARLTVDPRAMGFVAALIAFALLVEPVGFIPVGVAFTASAAWLLGSRRAWRVAATALITPIVLYLAFVEGFGIALPKGIVGWIF